MEGILDTFYKWERIKADQAYLIQPDGSKYRNYTWKEVGYEARRIAASLQYHGFHPGDRIGILSLNCAEWIILDLAIIMGGYISVPLYANVNAETLHDILDHSGTRILFVGKIPDPDWETIKNAIPDEVFIVSLQGYEKTDAVPYQQFIRKEREVVPVSVNPDDTLTIIYTSGTTGKSKGVVHTHRSVMNAIASAWDAALLSKTGNRFFSYLPLSHAAERGLVEFGALYSGGSISFVHSIDTFNANMQHARPTHFFGVPRIWEKFQSRILEKIPQDKLDFYLGIPVLNTIVKRKIKKALGLQNARLLLSGAAPISQTLMRWFHKLGFKIQEAYGMSENFNVCTINPQHSARIGTVGKLFPGQELVIDPETKEIKQRCDWMMKEYYKEPGLTAQAIRNGFLHTGDMGELSGDGFLTISGRVKDIFKTTKGEYIIPSKTEMKFLALHEVEQACVLGQHYAQPFIVIILSALGKSMDEGKLNAVLSEKLDECNQGCMDYQKIRKIIIANEEWTNENKLLTPTLKMKRNAISEKYELEFRDLYFEKGCISRERQTARV